MWTQYDYSIVTLLTSFMRFSRYQDNAEALHIFAIMYDGKDIYENVKDYVKCMTITDNMTPRVVQLLYNYTKGHDKLAPENDKKDFYIVDFELQEQRYDRDEFLVAS